MNIRPRILRKNQIVRNMVSETNVSILDLITPIFVQEGKKIKKEISSMPDYYVYSLDFLLKEIESLMKLGLYSFMLFPKIENNLKDNTGKEALNKNGFTIKCIKEIKKKFPEICLITDIALDPFSLYGHDGIVEKEEINNDKTIEILSKMAVIHAENGADFVAPSDMMDGRIGKIRNLLEKNNLKNTGIISYAVKYASSFYGPFRDALDSAPGFVDKKSYQMDFRNSKEAIKEAKLDVKEGADMIIVKPGLAYLDIIKTLSKKIYAPIVAYQVSGEYSMLMAGFEKKWLDKDKIILETLFSFKRAGASLIASYFSPYLVKNKIL